MTVIVIGLAALASCSLGRAVSSLRAAGARRRVRRLVGDGDGPPTRTTTSLASLVAGLAPLVALVVVGPGAALVTGVGAIAGGRWWRVRRLEAGRRRDVEHLPEVVDGVARAVRAGHPLVEALAANAARAPSSLATSITAAVDAAHRGIPVAEAIDRWGRSSPVDGAPLVATALVLSIGAGGDAARALEGVSTTLRDRAALRREVRALSAQARLSALVIAAAPIAFAALAAAADPATGTLLFRTPLGWACLAVGLSLDVAGWRWMASITEAVR